MRKDLARRLRLGGVALLVTLPLAACSAGEDSTKAIGDPGYLFNKVASARAATADVIEPASLEQALPGQEPIIDPTTGQQVSKWSDLVVKGAITDVRPGDAIVYDDPTSGYGEKFHEVDFDDPAAHERSVMVTMKVDWAEGDDTGDTLEFRMGVLAGADPYEFMASLRGLQGSRVVVVLDTIEDSDHAGDYYPIMSGALIGQVDATGQLSFPALGAEQDSFIGDIDTASELQEVVAETDPGVHE